MSVEFVLHNTHYYEVVAHGVRYCITFDQVIKRAFSHYNRFGFGNGHISINDGFNYVIIAHPILPSERKVFRIPQNKLIGSACLLHCTS